MGGSGCGLCVGKWGCGVGGNGGDGGKMRVVCLCLCPAPLRWQISAVECPGKTLLGTTQQNTHTHTHTMVTANKNKARKAVERTLLRDTSAVSNVLDIFRLYGDKRAAQQNKSRVQSNRLASGPVEQSKSLNQPTHQHRAPGPGQHKVSTGAPCSCQPTKQGGRDSS